jgi:hypothetical protein
LRKKTIIFKKLETFLSRNGVLAYLKTSHVLPGKRKKLKKKLTENK